MKKTVTLLLLCSTFWGHSKTANTTKILEYMPAPGQFINTAYTAYNSGDDSITVLKNANASIISNNNVLTLGTFGGYITYGFDHSILHQDDNYDLYIAGNCTGTSPEIGIVSVSEDRNGNGLPDDEWFELASGEYYTKAATKNYSVTYFRPKSSDNDTVRWIDNLGKNGIVTPNNFHKQCYYPAWITTDSYTVKGTMIDNNATPTYGYVDHGANSSDLSKFKISWAVDSLGRKVFLSKIDFVRVHTAQLKINGIFGEISTEVGIATDLHENRTERFVGENYKVLDLSSIALDSNNIWENTYKEGKILTVGDYIFGHDANESWGTFEGFTISNNSDNSNYRNDFYTENPWGCMAKGGYKKEGDNFLIGFYNSIGSSSYVTFSDNSKRNMIGAYICASPLTYYSHYEDLDFTRKFKHGDYFKLTATGKRNGEVVATADFYLADFRDVDSTKWYANRTWEWFDLTPMQNVDSVFFSLESTDSGEWGMNTATYFCMDKITSVITNPTDLCTTTKNSNASISKIQSKNNQLHINANGDSVIIISPTGQIVYSNRNCSENNITVNAPGTYVVIRKNNN